MAKCKEQHVGSLVFKDSMILIRNAPTESRVASLSR